ncbi:hypothetical protein Ahy_A02g006513 [Arachis hypogaea]|uniref:Endonuclease/exonuclease/phosphatase domain-containing protein n=1 Tax=Arachis hypogaea TaxID=3818 RepID=A0A445EA65_ARAHY|nr:hypothetical protein Ahy_A02g006513 [Arachis hypogaea]
MEGTRSSHRKSPNGQKTNQDTQNQQSNLEKKENLAAIIMNDPPITPKARHQNKQVFQNMAINQESIYEEQNYHTTKVLITSIMGGGYNNEISKEEGNKPPDLSEFSSKLKKDKNMKKLDLQKGEVTYQNVEMDVQAINSKTNEAQGVSAKRFSIIIKYLTYWYNLNLCVLLETYVSGSKADVIIHKLGFESWCRSEAKDFAGGIWCLWNKKDPQPGTWSSLWKELENFAVTIQGPWCVGGDFNSIIFLEEIGGSFNLSQDSRRFQECIQNCGLKDLSFSVPPFTWQRNRVKIKTGLVSLQFGFQ